MEVMIASFNACWIRCVCGSLLLKHLNWIRDFLLRLDLVPKPMVCHFWRLLDHQRVLHEFALLVPPHRLFLKFEQIDGHIERLGREQPLAIEIIFALPGEGVPHEFFKPLKLFLLFMLLDGLFARQFNVGCLSAFRGVLSWRVERYCVLDYRVVSVKEQVHGVAISLMLVTTPVICCTCIRWSVHGYSGIKLYHSKFDFTRCPGWWVGLV